MTLPDVKIKGGRQTRKERAKPAVSSNFFLTLNSNQRYEPEDPHREEDAEAVEDVVKEIVQNLPRYVKIIEKNHKWSTDVIEDVDVEYAVEYGEKSKALHAHILVRIKHRSRVQLDFEAIKRDFAHGLGLKNVYFDSRLLRAPSDHFLQEYIRKMR